MHIFILNEIHSEKIVDCLAMFVFILLFNKAPPKSYEIVRSPDTLPGKMLLIENEYSGHL